MTARVRTWCAALGGAVAVVVLTLTATPARAQEAGVVEEGTTTWVVRPDEGVVDLTIELAIGNTTPADPTTRTFWTSWGVAMPTTPDRVTVRRGDTVLDDAAGALDDGTPTVTWDFPDPLDRGERDTYVVEARFASAPPRSDVTAGPRVAPAFVAVPVWAWGRDAAAVTVRIPSAMDATLGADPPTSRDGTTDVWELQVDGPSWGELLLGSSDDGGHVDEVVTIGDTRVTVRSWPDDPEWGQEVAAFAAEALPLLADWAGTAWDGDELTIRETAAPFVEGWGGANDGGTNTISVGEDYDRAVWTHELAHNWFGSDEFTETWLAEGLSDLATAQLAGELGVEDPPVPDPPDRVLTSWDEVVERAARTRLADPAAWQATVGDLYAGAHHVVATVAEEVGPERFREMVRMTLEEESSWSGPGEVAVPEAADWREFLTLAERVGGSTTARGLLLEHVVPDAGPELARRDEVLAALVTLEEGPWATPLQVRRALQAWNLDAAERDIAHAVRLRDDLAATTDRAAGLGVGVPDLRTDWEVGTLARVADRLVEVDAVLDAIAALAADAGAADLPVPRLGVDPARDDLPAVVERVEALSLAVQDVVDARATLAEARTDRVVVVGLVGSEPERLLEDASAALAAGDVAQVATATDRLDDLLEQADRRGRALAWTAAAVVVVALVLLVLVLRRRRRRRRPDDIGPTQSPGQAPASSSVNAGGR